MSPVLVLDAEALSSLARQHGTPFVEVRAALEATRRLNRDVLTPAVILAELFRGSGHNSLVDACLNRETGIGIQVTDRSFARLVGGALTAADSGSAGIADAHCVAAAVQAGGGVVLTGDRADLERLSAAYPNVHVAVI